MKSKKIIIWAVLDVLLFLVILGECGILLNRRNSAKPDVKQQIETLLSEAPKSEKWALYISGLEGPELLLSNAEQSIRAGTMEYFFMAEQLYSDIRRQRCSAHSADAAEELLRNRNGNSYRTLMYLCREGFSRREDRMYPDLDGESYPFTFWKKEESRENSYTCVKDGSLLLRSIVGKAKAGDIYAGNELELIREDWNNGIAAEMLKGQTAELFEISSKRTEEGRLEDFAFLTPKDGSGYVVGIMAQELTDMTAAEEKAGKIMSLAHEYYSR